MGSIRTGLIPQKTYMKLLAIGLNHQTAPVALREKIAFSPEQLFEVLPGVREAVNLHEVAILSTCNRTEIYCISESESPDPLMDWICQYHNLANSELASSIYIHREDGVVSHMMRVACGLDSMVIGEPQILGQMKTAFAAARSAGTLGPRLDRLSQKTNGVAKQVRTQTAIGENPVSVAYAAVTLSQQIFSDLSNCNALMIGAGETIELVSRHLVNAGLKNLTIANRTFSRAQTLAQLVGGRAIELSEIGSQLAGVDILIASTASALPILGKGTVESALKSRRHSPIFMVDLAVPRDIEQEVAELEDVYLYSVDDLHEIIASNLKSREDAAAEAELIIQQGVKDYNEHHRSLAAVATLVDLRKKYEKVKANELTEAINALEKGADPRKTVERLATRLTNKIIHSPSIQLRRAGSEGADHVLRGARTLFELDDDQE